MTEDPHIQEGRKQNKDFTVALSLDREIYAGFMGEWGVGRHE